MANVDLVISLEEIKAHLNIMEDFDLDDDLLERYGGNGSGLKSITGGDVVKIEAKYKNGFKAVIQAIVMIVNNEATRFTERCGGIDRRRVIYHFDRVVPDEQRDPHLLAKIEQEISGIVYQLMQRFKDPMDAKRALHNQQTSAEALEVKSQTDHITEFCGYFLTSDKCDGLFIGNARMFGKERTHLYPAYLCFHGRKWHKRAEPK
ncbi:hypothetical protein [Avibacterium avium]|uniref:hypothetical protein n=1 Tax=Avibacterium avium TaxID=751 RepID=UPI003BF7E93F